MTPETNIPDHDLLQRIYVQVQSLQTSMSEMKAVVQKACDETTQLKVASARNSAMYGALSGLVAALLLSLAIAGIHSLGG